MPLSRAPSFICPRVFLQPLLNLSHLATNHLGLFTYFLPARGQLQLCGFMAQPRLQAYPCLASSPPWSGLSFRGTLSEATGSIPFERTWTQWPFNMLRASVHEDALELCFVSNDENKRSKIFKVLKNIC